jgi:hypothetical protein
MGWYHSLETLLDFVDLVMCLGVNPHRCTTGSEASEDPAHLILPPLFAGEMLILILRLAEVDSRRFCSCSRKKMIVGVVRNVGTVYCAESNQ